MSHQTIVDFSVNAAMLMLLLSMLPILVATVIGLIVSLLQALTQIQEQTLGFAVKLVAVAATLLLSMHWMGAELYNYTLAIFQTIETSAP
ncbi:MAG TPA: type III secretion system export apparatus subunit SctS [Caulifigura sp.]|jgi:type III secretion protein S|nr:type III secretion system export apparatus subunit SctS [Caulifigura sp.]